MGELVDRQAGQQFRDVGLERQLTAYILRVDWKLALRAQPTWLSDEVCRYWIAKVKQRRVTMVLPMAVRELKNDKAVGSSVRSLYLDGTRALYPLKRMTPKEATLALEHVEKLWESRGIVQAAVETIESIRDFNLEDTKGRFLHLVRPRALVEGMQSGEYLSAYQERLAFIRSQAQARMERGLVGVPTGIDAFDRMTSGLLPGEFGIIGGTTGVGKTATLVSFTAHAWLKGYNVLLVSGEMGRQALEFRLDSNLSLVSGTSFRKASLSKEQYRDWDQTITYYRHNAKARLHVCSFTTGFTVENLEAEMTRIEEETGEPIQFLALDYINILKPSRGSTRNGPGWEDQAAVILEYKSMVAERELVSWSAGQLVDDAYGAAVLRATHLKYGRVISENAPFIVGLVQTDENKAIGRLELQIIKMRSVEPPTFPILLNPNLDVMHIHTNLSAVQPISTMSSAYVQIQKQEANRLAMRAGKAGRKHGKP